MAEPYKEPNAFRSTPMSFVQILMQREAAHDSVLEVVPSPRALLAAVAEL
jgi:hypothetical protein